MARRLQADRLAREQARLAREALRLKKREARIREQQLREETPATSYYLPYQRHIYRPLPHLRRPHRQPRHDGRRHPAPRAQQPHARLLHHRAQQAQRSSEPDSAARQPGRFTD
jgi:hypothetical protein